jgi:hypothetical protein
LSFACNHAYETEWMKTNNICCLSWQARQTLAKKDDTLDVIFQWQTNGAEKDVLKGLGIAQF